MRKFYDAQATSGGYNANDSIATAEELLNSAELHIKSTSYLTAGECQKAMLLFAKLHVTAALKAAHSCHQIPMEDVDFTLDSYPLTLII